MQTPGIMQISHLCRALKHGRRKGHAFKKLMAVSFHTWLYSIARNLPFVYLVTKLLCRVTQSGALEGVTRVNVKTKNKESEEPLLKQRENSHEYD